jgi:hypothetical protein
MDCDNITSTAKKVGEKNNDTRLSATAHAISTLKDGHDKIKNALLDIAAPENEELLVKAEAKSVAKSLRSMTTLP